MKTHASLRLLTSVLAVGVCLSGLGLAGVALISTPPVWFLLGFELLMACAGVVAFQTARGRNQAGPSLTLLCVAGVVAVSAFLGYLGASQQVLGVSLKPVLIARLGASAVFVVVAGWPVLARRPKASFGALARSLIAGVGSVASAGAVVWFFGMSASWNGPLRILALFVLGAITLGLFAAAVHCAIRAFQVGLAADDEALTR